MNIESILKIISSTYNLDYLELQKLINNNLKENILNNNDNNLNNINNHNKIILPYYGNIIDSNCKGLVYNHGLYTQCTEKSKNLCGKCVKNKYGTVEDRKKYEIGKYIAPNGKKEIDYNVLLNRLKYNIKDVIKEFQNNNIDIEKFNIKQININEKKGRGRPKKIVENNLEKDTIEVVKYIYREEIYLKTNDNILLNSNTYDIVGIINKEGELEIW
tara:strand:- start:374 stop:1021 length:648 start_codon:yes stop_codon:yes gene_type:complete